MEPGQTVNFNLGPKNYLAIILEVDVVSDPKERIVLLRVFGKGAKPPFGDFVKSAPYAEGPRKLHWNYLENM